MIVNECLSNIDSIINDMKMNNQRIRSVFRFSMGQAAKNSYHYHTQSSNQIYQTSSNSISLNPKFYEKEKDQLFGKLQIETENQNKTFKSNASTLPMSDREDKKRRQTVQDEKSAFPDTLMQIQEESDQNELNYNSIEHESQEENRFSNKLNNFGTSKNEWFITNKRSTIQKHLKSQFSPEEKICEFEHE